MTDQMIMMATITDEPREIQAGCIACGHEMPANLVTYTKGEDRVEDQKLFLGWVCHNTACLRLGLVSYAYVDHKDLVGFVPDLAAIERGSRLESESDADPRYNPPGQMPLTHSELEEVLR